MECSDCGENWEPTVRQKKFHGCKQSKHRQYVEKWQRQKASPEYLQSRRDYYQERAAECRGVHIKQPAKLCTRCHKLHKSGNRWFCRTCHEAVSRGIDWCMVMDEGKSRHVGLEGRS